MRISPRHWTSPLATWTTKSYRWKRLDSTIARSRAALSTVDTLVNAGWDVLHASQCGLATASDELILDFARKHNRVLCTLDADFHALLAVSDASGPSVVRIRREGMRGSAVASLLVRVWHEVSATIELGAVVTVTEKSIRLRRLPIGGDPDKGEAE